MLFSHQNVKKKICISFYGNLPYNLSYLYFSCSFISFLTLKEHPLYYSSECVPIYCVLILDTVDQSANEMHDFAGHAVKVGEIKACAPVEVQA